MLENKYFSDREEQLNSKLKILASGGSIQRNIFPVFDILFPDMINDLRFPFSSLPDDEVNDGIAATDL